MELPKRKQLRLQGYDYSQNEAYFVTICTAQRAELFGEIIQDTVGAHLCVRPHHPERMVQGWLYELENKYANVVIDCYVLMPDHIHFILMGTGAHIGAPLPEIVKWFKTQTTNAYIAAVKSGEYPPFEKHVWQRNYYEHVIRNEADLQETRKYIAENLLNRKGKHLGNTAQF